MPGLLLGEILAINPGPVVDCNGFTMGKLPEPVDPPTIMLCEPSTAILNAVSLSDMPDSRVENVGVPDVFSFVTKAPPTLFGKLD